MGGSLRVSPSSASPGGAQGSHLESDQEGSSFRVRALASVHAVIQQSGSSYSGPGSRETRGDK